VGQDAIVRAIANRACRFFSKTPGELATHRSVGNPKWGSFQAAADLSPPAGVAG